MESKRCDWCGTLSPADAERCVLCRLPLSSSVPPPQLWSPAEPPTQQPVEPPVEPPTSLQVPEERVPEPAVEGLADEVPADEVDDVPPPTWQAPDDPTYALLAAHLDERARRRRQRERDLAKRRKARRLRRIFTWVVALALVAAFLYLAPGTIRF